MFKNISLFICFVISLNLFACTSLPQSAKELIGKPAPSNDFYLLSGDSVSLNTLRGRKIVILFWASWCPHCRETMDDFDALAKKYKDTNAFFVTVSLDKSMNFEDVKSILKGRYLSFAHHAFSGNDVEDENFRAYHGEKIPYTVIIDENGIVRSLGLGVSDAEDFFEE